MFRDFEGFEHYASSDDEESREEQPAPHPSRDAVWRAVPLHSKIFKLLKTRTGPMPPSPCSYFVNGSSSNRIWEFVHDEVMPIFPDGGCAQERAHLIECLLHVQKQLLAKQVSRFSHISKQIYVFFESLPQGSARGEFAEQLSAIAQFCERENE